MSGAVPYSQELLAMSGGTRSLRVVRSNSGKTFHLFLKFRTGLINFKSLFFSFLRHT